MTAQKFRYFVIFGAMRTGSNLLERTIGQVDGIRTYGELFNPAFIGGPNNKALPSWSVSQRDAAPLDLRDAMIADAAPHLPGFRYFPDHDPRVLAPIIQDESAAKIILRRAPIDSYVSWKIALATGQWVLGGIAHRKSAKAHFDANEFETFTSARTSFYHDIHKRLAAVGQTAFELQYRDLKSLPIINGLAKYLGRPDGLAEFEEPLKRQNPEPLHEKIENYAEFERYAAAQAIAGQGANAAPHLELSSEPAPDTQGLIGFASAAHNLIYLPIPGAMDDALLAGLRAQAPLKRLKGLPQIEAWLAENPSAERVSLVTNPATRALGTFRRHILPGPTCFENIRKRLIANFDLPPDINPDDSTDVAQGFESFLKFLEPNLAGQTAIRTADVWTPQTTHLSKLNSHLPVSQLWRAENLPQEFSQAAAPAPQIEPEALTKARRISRRIYGRDYLLLGY